MQPYRGRARPAVVNEGDGALAEIFHVASRVGRVINQRGWFILFVPQENRSRRGLVGNRLTADLDAVIRDGRFFLGRRSSGCFYGLISWFGIFVLRARTRGNRGHGQGQRQQHAQVFHTDHRFSPRNNSYFVVDKGEILPVYAEPWTILFDGR